MIILNYLSFQQILWLVPILFAIQVIFFFLVSPKLGEYFKTPQINIKNYRKNNREGFKMTATTAEPPSPEIWLILSLGLSILSPYRRNFASLRDLPI